MTRYHDTILRLLDLIAATQADALENWQQLELLVGMPLSTLASAPESGGKK